MTGRQSVKIKLPEFISIAPPPKPRPVETTEAAKSKNYCWFCKLSHDMQLGHQRNQEESIYDLLPQQQPAMAKPPMYRSKVCHNTCICAPRMQLPPSLVTAINQTILLLLQHPGELETHCSSTRVRPAATMGRAQVRCQQQAPFSTDSVAVTTKHVFNT